VKVALGKLGRRRKPGSKKRDRRETYPRLDDTLKMPAIQGDGMSIFYEPYDRFLYPVFVNSVLLCVKVATRIGSRRHRT